VRAPKSRRTRVDGKGMVARNKGFAAHPRLDVAIRRESRQSPPFRTRRGREPNIDDIRSPTHPRKNVLLHDIAADYIGRVDAKTSESSSIRCRQAARTEEQHDGRAGPGWFGEFRDNKIGMFVPSREVPGRTYATPSVGPYDVTVDKNGEGGQRDDQRSGFRPARSQ